MIRKYMIYQLEINHIKNKTFVWDSLRKNVIYKLKIFKLIFMIQKQKYKIIINKIVKNNNNFIKFNKSTMIYKMVNNNSYKYNKLMKFRRKIKFFRH